MAGLTLGGVSAVDLGVLALSLLLLLGTGARIYLLPQLEGDARWRAYRNTALPFLAGYLLLLAWGAGLLLVGLLVLEVALWGGIALYRGNYASLFAQPEALRPLVEELSRTYGEPERFAVSEASPVGGGEVRATAYAWRFPPAQARGRPLLRVWLFPHVALKDAGAGAWVPALPKGAAVLLRRGGGERDILLFPEAPFPRAGMVFAGKYIIGIGREALDTLPAYVEVEGALRQRRFLGRISRQELLEDILKALPGWRGYLDIPVEDRGTVDFYLAGPGTVRVFVFLQGARGRRSAALEGAKEVRRLLQAPVVVWEPSEGHEPAWQEENGVHVLRAGVEGLAAWLVGRFCQAPEEQVL